MQGRIGSGTSYGCAKMWAVFARDCTLMNSSTHSSASTTGEPGGWLPWGCGCGHLQVTHIGSASLVVYGLIQRPLPPDGHLPHVVRITDQGGHSNRYFPVFPSHSFTSTLATFHHTPLKAYLANPFLFIYFYFFDYYYHFIPFVSPSPPSRVGIPPYCPPASGVCSHLFLSTRLHFNLAFIRTTSLLMPFVCSWAPTDHTAEA
ncbi:uncharacterized protein LY79DRAFT_247938 [Colletotrichum navitas]|uniref:Uncharacterized protein n=1 Tax=Colletotrichum navitas TaxID=681940 RepID=A0AAD8Q9M1_9PEZI|nr:uncharacterized protein LY79DRAFT_247938 [Colletotrichum navitas]KAK1598561.1 hypothetical protein LY79DRAFT_247938 [Colletotrichum navitas]